MCIRDRIHVDLPDLNERKEVFGVHLKPLKLDESVDPVSYTHLYAEKPCGKSGGTGLCEGVRRIVE